jgi:hypothetical protein
LISDSDAPNSTSSCFIRGCKLCMVKVPGCFSILNKCIFNSLRTLFTWLVPRVGGKFRWSCSKAAITWKTLKCHPCHCHKSPIFIIHPAFFRASVGQY